MAARPPRTWGQRIRRGLLYLIVGWLALTIVPVIVFRFVPPPTTMFMVLDRLSAWTSGDYYPLQHKWVNWSDINANAKVAVIAAEDQKFPDHHGFDFDSIQDAIEARENGGRVRGASTISQQTAKNLFLWPDSNWVRKGFEVYFTVLLEVFWDKKRILEVYLNSAEFGRGVFGVGAATQYFWNKLPINITPEQAARLAAVLPSPKHYDAEKPGRYVQRRAKWIQNQMRKLGGASLLTRVR